MLQRCENPNDPAYPRYGGRGISVCFLWHNYWTFRRWAISKGYADNLTIDRRDNNLGYCPENCRWATKAQQNQNRRVRSSSPYKGVGPSGLKWQAHICLEGERKYLGTFETAEDAARAYDSEAVRLFKEFAFLNFPQALTQDTQAG